jgi:hypothetical protein
MRINFMGGITRGFTRKTVNLHVELVSDVALSTLASTQTKDPRPTQPKLSSRYSTMQHLYPDAIICYHASDMVLCTHINASYLSEPQSGSHTGGHFFLSDKPVNPTKAPIGQPKLNGPAAHTTCHILCSVMASATEAEISSLFINGQDSIPFHPLNGLVHLQLPMPIQTRQLRAWICPFTGSETTSIKADSLSTGAQEQTTSPQLPYQTSFGQPPRANGVHLCTTNHPTNTLPS